MKNILTFIIPVRHQNNAKNWSLLKQRLSQTINSICAQDESGWNAVIVANHGAELPELPKGFEVKRVDFPPNNLYSQGSAEQEQFWEAFRIDKGRRVLAGMLHAGEMGHVMIVDDDDFVSKRLTSFVAANSLANGWYVENGYIWTEGGNLLFRYADFSHLCGTSHIVRADLYALPVDFDAADEKYISRMLGSHIFIHDHLSTTGTPLAPLPFVGAVYRTGHSGAHSNSRGILRQYIFRKELVKRPWVLPHRISCLQFKTRRIEAEFFGHSMRS
jgi:hypothetical protein